MNIPKFRAWFKEQKCMFDVDGIDFVNSIFSYREDIYQYDAELSNVILMQSTGLTDKNGVEIFKDSIVKTNWQNRIGYIDYVLGEFVLREGFEITSLSLLIRQKWSLEVIGNIHQNGDLLNV